METLDFLRVEADPGRVVFQGRPGFAALQPDGLVHGGWFATLLDSALGCAVASVLRRARPTRPPSSRSTSSAR
jgi:acyl-coenzyme A thioesterase PaaI-like protein